MLLLDSIEESHLATTIKRRSNQVLVLLTLQAGVISVLGYRIHQNKIARAQLQSSLECKSNLLRAFHRKDELMQELAKCALQEAISLTRGTDGCVCASDGARDVALASVLYEVVEGEEDHSNRVSQLCFDLAHELGLDDKTKSELRITGLFHDIGKNAIAAVILNKPGKLTEEEWKEIKRHPEIGYRVLNSLTGMEKIAETVLAHHERWDGSGYPRGLQGIQIPFMARIVAVADAYDAMVNTRPYRVPLSRREALDELERCAGTHFDPAVVDAFFRLVEKEENQTYV